MNVFLLHHTGVDICRESVVTEASIRQAAQTIAETACNTEVCLLRSPDRTAKDAASIILSILTSDDRHIGSTEVETDFLRSENVSPITDRPFQQKIINMIGMRSFSDLILLTDDQTGSKIDRFMTIRTDEPYIINLQRDIDSQRVASRYNPFKAIVDQMFDVPTEQLHVTMLD